MYVVEVEEIINVLINKYAAKVLVDDDLSCYEVIIDYKPFRVTTDGVIIDCVTNKRIDINDMDEYLKKRYAFDFTL